MLILLIVLLILFGGGGFWGHSRFGYAGWSPFGLLLIVIILLALTGHLNL